MSYVLHRGVDLTEEERRDGLTRYIYMYIYIYTYIYIYIRIYVHMFIYIN